MEYDNMTIVVLKALAKKRGLRGYSKLKKAELITFLQNKTSTNARSATQSLPTP